MKFNDQKKLMCPRDYLALQSVHTLDVLGCVVLQGSIAVGPSKAECRLTMHQLSYNDKCILYNTIRNDMDGRTMADAAGSWIKVAVDGGDMDAYLAMPANGAGPGIVMLQEIFGVNEAMIAKADMFADAGYTVLVPDVFWRMQLRVDLGYSEDDRAKAFGYMQKLDFAKAIEDIVSAFKALGDHPASMGKPSFVGYCLGGKLAVLAGAAAGDPAAVVSFYGVKLDDNIEQIKAMECPVVLHVGDNDAHIPMDVVAVLKEHLDPVDHVDVWVYPGAEHGFFNKVRTDVYAEEASKTAMERTLAVLPKPV
ncbi:MAG: dienelactone hydrolase family protein [Roseitalea sp.]|nr:dienelactone hydrolase family protein [Roseitalea sp.]